MDFEDHIPRGCSLTPDSKDRGPSLLNLMHLSWTMQNKCKCSPLVYHGLNNLKEKNSQVNMPHGYNESNISIPAPYGNSTNNLSTSSDLEPSVIPYQANQPMDPQLWDSNCCDNFR